MKGWYKTSDGTLYELETTNDISLCYMDLIELVIPDGVRVVWCWNNKLTELIIPDSVVAVLCDKNLLTKLIVPDQVEYINCRNNQLTKLIVSDNCAVDCDPGVNRINKLMYNRSKRLKNILK